jgi:hypothetical protein
MIKFQHGKRLLFERWRQGGNMNQIGLYNYTGNESQLFGVRRMVINEGRANNGTVLQVYTPSGLDLDILPGTGLDIGLLRYKGFNMSYLSKNGYDSPSVFIPYENEFEHTFPGGMLYTCGLRSVGPANRDKGEWFPLHGRIHGQSAVNVSTFIKNDTITISGTLKESALFGHLFQLKRQITIPIWESRIIIEDRIENLTPNPEEFMLLYHFNFGYPILSEKAKLLLPSVTATKPRNKDAERGMGTKFIFTKPIDNEPEQVFFHSMNAGEAILENNDIGITAELRWDMDSLPVFAQWKSMASGDYALGLEPSNCYIKGRNAERENGTLKILNGFSSLQTKIELFFKEIQQ